MADGHRGNSREHSVSQLGGARGPFGFLQDVASLMTEGETGRSRARDLVIRALGNRDEFEGLEVVLDGVLRELGLFPYVSDPSSLSDPDLLAYEMHRPVNYGDEIVFHPLQAQVYRKLLSGENVILSAPTSFGKSLILDAIVASLQFSNIVVVVPTIALIDEVRRRLSRFAADGYKIVTHASQSLSTRNVIVMTQERLLDLPELPDIDFYMIDEFYKLDMSSGETARAVSLNLALKRLQSTGATFYLAGPNVEDLAEGLPDVFEASFIRSDFGTVAIDVKRLEPDIGSAGLRTLIELCETLDGPTLIYCSSPNRARIVSNALLEAGLGTSSDESLEMANWIADEFMQGWVLERALRSGIGVHHGQIPRAVARSQVDLFNEGSLRFLVCTSTLIEGVNTSAKNVVIFDHRIGKNRRKIDYFTFANIRGRSGRMGRHFIGNVYIFANPPSESLPTVDIPLFSQTESAPDSLLIQLDRGELSEESRERMREFHDQSVVPLEVLRSNVGVDPSLQVELVRALGMMETSTLANLSWSGYPTYDQLQFACELVTQYLHPLSGRTYGVSSGKQLAFKLNLLMSARGDIKELIMNDYSRGPFASDADGAVEYSLAFLRYWPGFEFPRLILVLESLASTVLARRALRNADYSFYAGRVADLFLPPHVGSLEEFGIPTQVAMDLMEHLPPYEDLDGLLEGIRQLPVPLPLTGFAESVVRAAKRDL